MWLGETRFKVVRRNVSHALVVDRWTNHGRRQDVLPNSSSALSVSHLLVLIEADHLAEDLLSDLVDRRQLERSDAHLNVREL